MLRIRTVHSKVTGEVSRVTGHMTYGSLPETWYQGHRMFLATRTTHVSWLDMAYWCNEKYSTETFPNTLHTALFYFFVVVLSSWEVLYTFFIGILKGRFTGTGHLTVSKIILISMRKIGDTWSQHSRVSFWVWAQPIRDDVVTSSLIGWAHTQNDHRKGRNACIFIFIMDISMPGMTVPVFKRGSGYICMLISNQL